MKFTLIRPRNIRCIGIDDTWLIILGIPILSYIVPWLFFGLSAHESWVCFSQSWFIGVFNTALFWLGDRAIIIWFRKKYPTAALNRKRVIRSSLVIAGYTTIVSLFMHIGLRFAPPGSGNPFENASIWLGVGASLFATALVVAIHEAIYAIYRWKESVATAERLKKEHTEAQLEALKNQVNPHFLFNSLNTLSSIIPEDQALAVDFVQKLSSVYRGILDLKDQHVVTVAEELEALDSYLFLVKTRFGEGLQCSVHINDSCKHQYVVPMCLQILVENAIRHNVVSQKRPLKIEVFGKHDQFLVVRNNLQKKDQDTTGTGTGLSNINARFRMTFDREIKVVDGPEYFEVHVPLNTISEYTKHLTHP